MTLRFAFPAIVAALLQLGVPAYALRGTAQNASSGDRGELRGLWVVRTSLNSPASVHQVVVTAVKYHLNALFVQVRGRGDAWYNSHFEPRAEALASQPRSFDPLAQIVAEGHAAGLQVHAWMNVFLVWTGRERPSSAEHLWNAHRDWFACDRLGRCSAAATDTSEGAFLQPSSPEVQQHLVNVYTDLAANYDVDGIHFDYCRYAGPEYDFSAAALARFRADVTGRLTPEETVKYDNRMEGDRLAYAHAFPDRWSEWRREQLTAAVVKISTAVKSVKPYVQVSAAVFADAEEAYRLRGQDWQGWLRAGYLDAVALMAYDRRTERVLAETRIAVAAAGERQVYTGIGAWRLSAHDVARKIALVRRAGAAGVNLFSYDSVHTRRHYLDTLARGVFASRSAPPRMRWLPERNTTVHGETAEQAARPIPRDPADAESKNASTPPRLPSRSVQ